MKLTEKTLELNLTHELLDLADSIWGMALSTPALWNPSLPRPRRRPPYAAGLTLTEEAMRGYDVALRLPSSFPSGGMVWFLQFKKGDHRSYCNKRGSLFRANSQMPRHCLFGINNNTARDQHVRLTAISRNPGLSGAVLYALPCVTSQAAFLAQVGSLLGCTAFIDVDSVNQVAPQPIRVGQRHEVRVSYGRPHRWEVHSSPASSSRPALSLSLVSDICAARVIACVEQWQHSGHGEPAQARGWTGVLHDYTELMGQVVSEQFRNEAAEEVAPRITLETDGLSDYESSFAMRLKRKLEPILESANRDTGWTADSLRRSTDFDHLAFVPRGGIGLRLSGEVSSPLDIGGETYSVF